MEAGEFREERAAPVGASAELTEIDAGTTGRSPWQLFWKRFREDRIAMASLVFLVLLILAAIFAPVVCKIFGAPTDYDYRDTAALDPLFATPTGPSSDHLFGVDQLGRDVFTRTVYGARVSLTVAFSATFFATVLGVAFGLIAGFFRGWLDTLISRSVDVLLAIPYLLLATGLAAACTLGGNGCLGGKIDLVSLPLAIVGIAVIGVGVFLGSRYGYNDRRVPGLLVIGAILLLFGLVPVPMITVKPGVGVVIFVIAITSWTYMARIVRGQTLSLREKEFVEASRSIGASNMRIIFREVLPNLTAPIIVYSSILIPQVILYEAALSFLGVGVTNQPSWGQMISDATPIFNEAWWYMLFPGLALLFTVLAFNLVGDAMQDALNPRAKKS